MFEIELNRKWIYDNNGEVIGETNFVVPMLWLINNWKLAPNTMCASSYEMFIDVYEPETDGEWLYQKAKADDVLVEG